MRKLVLLMHTSLDGFVAGPNGEMNWVTDIFDEEMGKYEDELIRTADTLLLGLHLYANLKKFT